MITVIALIVAGVLLLALEVLVPGALLGIAGAAFLAGGVIAAWLQYGASIGGLVGLLALLLFVATLFIEFKVLPRSRLARAFSMTDTVTGVASRPPGRDLVGQECVALTKLRPSGYVTLAGAQFEAFCRSGAAEQGERLRVIDVDNFRLIVNSLSSRS
jgi:membrane-bound serine protease (ClpP class)